MSFIHLNFIDFIFSVHFHHGQFNEHRILRVGPFFIGPSIPFGWCTAGYRLGISVRWVIATIIPRTRTTQSKCVIVGQCPSLSAWTDPLALHRLVEACAAFCVASDIICEGHRVLVPALL